jgi:hypothetical protein
MKVLKKDLKTVAKNLKSLATKVEKMTKRLEKLEKAQAGKKPQKKVAKKRVAKKRVAKKKVAKKAVKVTAIDTVMGIIGRSREGVDAAALRKKTGFEGRKIRDLIYRLNKQGRITSTRKGFYVKK